MLTIIAKIITYFFSFLFTLVRWLLSGILFIFAGLFALLFILTALHQLTQLRKWLWVPVAYFLTCLRFFNINKHYYKSDDSLLTLAAGYNMPFICSSLIHRGINIHHRNRSGRAALDLTSDAGIAQHLLKHGAQWNAQFTKQQLLHALQKNNAQFVDLLCSTEPSMMQSPRILLYALKVNCNPHIVEKLITTGGKSLFADRTQRGRISKSIWKRAIAAYYPPHIIALMIKYGADPLAKDNDGLTALDYAKKYNRMEIVQLLEGKE